MTKPKPAKVQCALKHEYDKSRMDICRVVGGHERRLLVATRPALVVAVGPELVLHARVRVRHRLAPVEAHHHLLAAVAGLGGGGPERQL